MNIDLHNTSSQSSQNYKPMYCNFEQTRHGHNESETHDNFNITHEFNKFFHCWDGMKIIIHSQGGQLM